MDGAILRNFIENQKSPKKKIYDDLGISKTAFYQYFDSIKLTDETKKKFEDYFKTKIFTAEAYLKIMDKLEDYSNKKNLPLANGMTYLEKRRQDMLEQKEIWFPIMQGNTRLKENSTLVVYEDDPEMQIPIAFLPQSMYPGCDYGERAFGNSMYPRVVNQGFALGKVIGKNHIKYGELYGIHFKQPEGGPPVVKYVHRCKEDPTCIILHSDNKHVEDQMVSLEEVTFIFRVLYIVNPA